MIKKTVRKSSEISIARYLRHGGRNLHPHNHCVDILDVLPDPLDDTVELLVMPALMRVGQVKFWQISEVVDFMRQLLQVNELLLSIPYGS